MLGRMLATLIALMLLSISVPAQAAPFFSLQTGNWMEMDKQDNLGHHWTVRMMIFEQTTLDGKQYFRVQELYYDPYDINGGNTFSEFHMRSTDTELFFYNGPGLGETLAFKTGNVGDHWTYQEGTDTIYKEIVSTNDPITIPYGGAYTAYKYKHYNINTPGLYDLEWVVPGLGMVKEEDHWVDQTQTARIPLNSALARVGNNPLFFPLKTGMRLFYNANDSQGHTWRMHLDVLEQVTMPDDHLTYFHMRQVNYDPIAGDVNNEFYVRGNVSQMYARKLDENPAHLEYQAAAPETAWSYVRTPYTIYKKITGIQSVNVLGRSYSAYVTNQSSDPSFPVNLLMSEFIVPGLGPVEMLDWWISDSNRAPLQFLLTGVSQGGVLPAVGLLLMD